MQIYSVNLDTLFDILDQEPVRLLGGSGAPRMEIVQDYFPDVLCRGAQTIADKGGRMTEVILSLPETQRTFCRICAQIDAAFKNYLNYFFTAQREKSTTCRSLFVSSFGGERDPVEAMTVKCAAALKRAGLDGLPTGDSRRSALIIRLEKAMEALVSRLPALAAAKEAILSEIREDPARALARTIASYAVYLDTSEFKNDRKRQEMNSSLQEMVYAIWQLRPQDAAWQSCITSGVEAFHSGDYPRAAALFADAQSRLLKEDRRSNYNTAAYADLLSYQAHMLMDGSVGERSVDKACQLILKALRVRDGSGREVSSPRRLYESAFCQLFHAQDWARASAESSDPIVLLEQAAQGGCSDAAVLLADVYLTGAHGYEKLMDEQKGVALLEMGAACEAACRQERAKCELRLAEHYMQTRGDAWAEAYFEKAARLGSYHATVRLREKYFSPESCINVQIPVHTQEKTCFFNGADGMNDMLCLTLPQGWTQHGGDPCALIQQSPQLLQGRLLFSLLSSDEKRNLQDALQLIKLLNSVAYAQPPENRDAWIERIDLFVLLRSETSRKMIDAAMNNLAPDVYFKVHLCDPDEMAANELLLNNPTFAPCIDRTGSVRREEWKNQKKHERCQRRVVVLGTSGCAQAIVRQMIAATGLEAYPTVLDVVGTDADTMSLRMQEECPGVFDADMPRHITPRFHRCDLDLLPINRCSEQDMQLHAALHAADYLVVAGDDDMRNVELAIRLRTGLIRSHLQKGTQPLIAVLYRDAATRWLASQIAVGTSSSVNADRYHWTENYDPRIFGCDSAFSYQSLMEQPLEARALSVHCSYYGSDLSPQQLRSAAAQYYRRSYNRDSSACLALGIIYHCFGMGVYHAHVENYASRAQDAVLGQQYHALIHPNGAPDEEMVEKAATIEHSRWVGWSLSRGWTRPDDQLLTAYIRMGNPRHYLEIGKLHPYIAGYQQIVYECQKINELLAAYQFPPRTLSDPRQSDRALTQRIPHFLGWK